MGASDKMTRPATILIAFDSEFAEGPFDRKGRRTHQLLCYTLACCDPSNPENSVSTILWPRQGRENRYTSAQLISHALTLCESEGIGLNPSTGKLESNLDVILAAHFSRADICQLADFQTLRKYGSIRSTFATAGQGRLRDIRLLDGRKRSIKLSLADTMLLAPASAKSLEKIGAALSFDKLSPGKVIDEKGNEIDAITRMDLLLEQDIERFTNYAVRDAEVTLAALYSVIFNVVQGDMALGDYVPPTLGSTAVRLFLTTTNVDLGDSSCPIRQAALAAEDRRQQSNKERQRRKEEIGQLDVLEGEQAVGLLLGRVTTRGGRIRSEFTEGARRISEAASNAYHGGRNTADMIGYWTCECFKGRLLRDFDVRGAYAAAMALFRWVDFEKSFSCDDLDQLCAIDGGLGVGKVRFAFPGDTLQPCLPVDVGDQGLIYPLEGISDAIGLEIDLARRMGAKIEIIDAWFTPWFDQSNAAARPFVEFTKTINRLRADAARRYGKKSFQEQIIKDVGNNLYGKLAQAVASMKSDARAQRIFDASTGNYRDLEVSKVSSPIFAAFISGVVRALVSEILWLLSTQSTEALILSATTDGILTSATCDEANAACHGPIGDLFSQCRLLVDPDRSAAVLEQKHASYDALVFKTRGTWSFKPAFNATEGSQDRIHPERNEVMSSLLSAKAGHKLPSRVDDPLLENEAWRRIHRNRRAGQLLEQRTFISIADQWHGQHDLYKETRLCALSMDYDMKRQPIGVHDGHDGLIRFNTIPWKTRQDFEDARIGLDRWRKRAREEAKRLRPDKLEHRVDQDFDAPLPPAGVAMPGVLLRAVDYQALQVWWASPLSHDHRALRAGDQSWTPVQRAVVTAWAQALPGYPKRCNGLRYDDGTPNNEQIAKILSDTGLKGIDKRIIENAASRNPDPRRTPSPPRAGDAQWFSTIVKHLDHGWRETTAAMVLNGQRFVARVDDIASTGADMQGHDTHQDTHQDNVEQASKDPLEVSKNDQKTASKIDAKDMSSTDAGFSEFDLNSRPVKHDFVPTQLKSGFCNVQNELLDSETYRSELNVKTAYSITNRGERKFEDLSRLFFEPQNQPEIEPQNTPSATSKEEIKTQIDLDDWKRLDQLLEQRLGVGPVRISQAMKRLSKRGASPGLTGAALKGAARIDAIIKATGMTPGEAAAAFEQAAMDLVVTAAKPAA